jgi:thiol:disulfide interchange protein DsbD
MRGVLAALAMLAAAASPAVAMQSAPVHSARATATLLSDVDSVAPGKPVRVALRLSMAPGWHTYWRNPGDAGIAPELTWTLPPGATAGAIEWPAPARETEGPLVTFGYSGDLLLPVAITGATGPLGVQLHAEWLICAKVCVPESGDFRLDLPAGTGAPSPQAALFAKADQRAPRPSPWPARISADGALFVPGLENVRDAWFAPDMIGATEPAAPAAVATVAGGLRLRLKPGQDFRPGTPLSGVLTVVDAGGMESALQLQASPGEVPADAPAPGLLRLLGLALLGGLVLNLMPCVFPVLAIKAVGLAGLAGARQRSAALYAGSYTAGVLAAFGALGGVLVGLRAAGGAAGWGFQFQSPLFVALTAWVLFAVGLNLSGVFDVAGGRLAGAGQALTAREGHAGNFFTGLLAVLVATPCTAPFMATAVAGALAAPPAAAIAVFLAMGLGLAAPYAAMALVPGIARALPRPGRWMDILKQVLAFPMYGATVWLVWVASLQSGPAGVLLTLAGVLLLGFAGWLVGLAQRGNRRSRAPYAVAALAVAATLALLPTLGGSGLAGAPLTSQAHADDGAEPFSAARLAALRAEHRPVFIDMTAAWCVTCLVNERVALAPEAVRRAFADRHVAYMKGDWTRQDPEISAFLRGQGRDGVPLYVFYPADGGAPTVLPQILTQGIVLAAIGAAES